MPDEKIFLFNRYKDYYLNQITLFRDIAQANLKDSEVKISIENISLFYDFQLSAIDILIKSPFFCFTYDIGHAANNQKKMDKFFSDNKNKLIHMHFHDAKKIDDMTWKNHLVLGSGELDLIHYLKFAEQTCQRIVLEIKTIKALKESVQWLKDNYFK